MIVLDKQTIKMLRYIKRKDTPLAANIINKFLDDDSDIMLISLCKSGYLLCIKDDGTYTDFSDEPLNTSSTYRYWATPLTNKLLQDRHSDLLRWILPTVLSLIALMLSIVTFIYTILDKSPILVRLLK